MKKILFLFLLVFGLTSTGYSQAAGKGSAEKGSGSNVKPRGQMRHFDRQKRDPKMKHNGTAYNRRKSGDQCGHGGMQTRVPAMGHRRS